jgi:hypothetical protein
MPLWTVGRFARKRECFRNGNAQENDPTFESALLDISLLENIGDRPGGA